MPGLSTGYVLVAPGSAGVGSMALVSAESSSERLADQAHAIARHQGVLVGIDPDTSRIREAMDARKKMRGRREIEVALGDAEGGALSVLEYRYVYRVERPHGLPVARRQARIRQGTRNRYLDNLYEENTGSVPNSTGPPRTQPTSSGATSGATMSTRSAASSRSGSGFWTWASADARLRRPSPRCCGAAAGRALPAHAGRAVKRLIHDHGQKWAVFGPNWPRS
jgi:hypothetical protein